MHRAFLVLAAIACSVATPPVLSQGQPGAATRPQIATTKVDGTDNVDIFRNGNHQAMFVVTNDGVIATDPVA